MKRKSALSPGFRLRVDAMNENELKSLKDLPPPPPRAGARARALDAAMAAFDQAASENAGEAAPKKNDAGPQGMAAPVSLTHASSAKKRSRTMRAWPVSYRIAASIAVLAIAAPAAFYAIQQGRENPAKVPSQESRNLTQTASPQGSAPVAPQSVKTAGAGEKGSAPPDAAPPAAPSLSAAKAPSPADGSQPADRRQLFRLGAAPKSWEAPGTHKSKAAQSAPAAQPAGRTRAQVARRETASRSAAGAPLGGRAINEQELAPVQPVSVPTGEIKDDRDRFDAKAPNPVKQVAAEPVSTFSIDVDTASYGFMRRALLAGHLPPRDSVRVEEMINYFPYNYPRPETASAPFRPTVTVTPAPWNPANKLIHIGIKGYDVTPERRPRANLVFLIDVSGSMSPPDRLPLVKNAFRMLVNELKPDDTVGVVTYASGSGVALEPTKVSDKRKILAAIDRLGAGGSTAGAQGLADAYRLAEENFDGNGVNRVILATDGDFNVGVSSTGKLKDYIEKKRRTGIFLSILGVGQNNYNDALMQALAQNGNGAAAYVDTLNEARKVLVEEASSTLFTIAKDVKIQIEFNPAQISEYRLIGYETRALKREDFNNDKVDAGDIGSGHTVTAIYEVTPVGAPKSVDDLRYQKPATKPAAAPQAGAGELAFLKLRYKLPKEDVSKLITLPVTRDMEKPDIASAPEDVRFSIAVAGFGQLLRDEPHLKTFGYDDVITLGQSARGADPFGYRAEFLNLARLAKSAR
jgi:Ca-activated chloride channel family protein